MPLTAFPTCSGFCSYVTCLASLHGAFCSQPATKHPHAHSKTTLLTTGTSACSPNHALSWHYCRRAYPQSWERQQPPRPPQPPPPLHPSVEKRRTAELLEHVKGRRNICLQGWINKQTNQAANGENNTMGTQSSESGTLTNPPFLRQESPGDELNTYSTMLTPSPPLSDRGESTELTSLFT